MSSLKSYLKTIADAIRQKKGTTEPIKAKNFASEILSIQGGGSLNVAYSLTPPTDTSKIWLQCAEPQAVEVQNYLGEASVGEVANYGGIDNPVDGHSKFYSNYGTSDGSVGSNYNRYYSACYIGENKIAIVGYNHIRIYDISTKSYIADYTISVSTSYTYTNVIYKDNVLYFAYYSNLYSYDLTTQTLTTLANDSNYSDKIKYIYFDGDYIECLVCNDYSSPGSSNLYRYILTSGSYTKILRVDGDYFKYIKSSTIKANNYVYNFVMYTTTSTNYYTWKCDLTNFTFTTFTSFYDFMTNLGWTQYYYSSAVYDGERYIYLIGGYGTYNGTSGTKSDLIIRYDTVNDACELLDNKLLGVKYNHFNVLVDNRVYIFGGEGTRKNNLDYFDISYPLNTNNVLITTNPNTMLNNLPLINTEKLKLNSNIASAYKGNADNLAEKVNAYYWDGSKWVGINCEDYVGSSGTGGGLGGSGDATTDPNIPVDKPVEM